MSMQSKASNKITVESEQAVDNMTGDEQLEDEAVPGGPERGRVAARSR